MIDRRFLNVSFVVNGIANEPSASPAPIKGTQYIVGDSGTGAFGNADENDIARYNGTSWTFTKPKLGNLEVFNLATLEILTWNGTAWAVSASLNNSSSSTPSSSNSNAPKLITVSGIMDAGSGAPDSEIEIHYDSTVEANESDDFGKLYYDISAEQLYIVWRNNSTEGYGWTEVSLESEDMKFLLNNCKFLAVVDSRQHIGHIEYKIYSFDDEAEMSEAEIEDVSIILVNRGTAYYEHDIGRTFVYNPDYETDDAWGQLVELSNTDSNSSSSSSSGVYIGTYALTASDITAKHFALTSAPALINNVRAVFISVGGVTQTQGVDYTVSDTNNVWYVDWTNKALDDVGLVAGDVFTIFYQTE